MLIRPGAPCAMMQLRINLLTYMMLRRLLAAHVLTLSTNLGFWSSLPPRSSPGSSSGLLILTTVA
jgi:hypothetical protein